MRPAEPSSMFHQSEITELLERAKSLMLADVEQEAREMESSIHPATINEDKYIRARSVFEKVLTLDPNNEPALQGISDCETMLQPYFPVQHLVPVTDIMISPPVDEIPPELQKVKRLPWEILRERRARDMRGVAYTANVFGKATGDSDRDVGALLNKARSRAGAGENKETIFREIETELREFQDGLDRSWKGHGPDMFTKAREQLKQFLGLPDDFSLEK